jgi:hypothetical protein
MRCRSSSRPWLTTEFSAVGLDLPAREGRFKCSCLPASVKAICWLTEWTRFFTGPRETLALSSELKQRGTESLGEIASHRAPPEIETAEQHYRQGLALSYLTHPAVTRGRARHAPSRRPLPPTVV